MTTCNEMAFFTPNFMLQPSHEEDHHSSTSSINPILHSCPPHHHPQDFHSVASLLGKRSSVAFSGIVDVGEDAATVGDDDLSDDGSHMGEKKRRLNMEQVKTLEKNFELGNKLEPERKMQLARALGLQPRQIAIWFQNRRARWKTKQLEKDYDLLKRQYDVVKADNDALQTQNKKLQAEISALKSRESTTVAAGASELMINLNKETDQGSACSNNSSADIKLDISRSTPPATTDHDSPLSSVDPIVRPLFQSPVVRPAANSTTPTTNVVHFFQNGPTKEVINMNNIQSQNHHHHSSCVQDDQSFTNMFSGIDDQQSFWPWAPPDHQQQQFH
ncbi:hypothetical protein Sjap_015773 [Stephania japonica]|uniref:Homeobox-leucine zipper protein n=1 Tax=Stephania japonica TaxID=461633 RepID=A0AAP0IJR4_9MAGN